MGLNKSSSFLPHVAGLRALAIIFVVLFHLDGALWSHGYLGVDVFLVISGYMLFRSRLGQSKPYGIKDTVGFLYKRGMRIMPPMAVTILLTIVVSILLMGAEDLDFLCGLIGYSLVGAANFSLRWSFEDYFAQDAAFIPLLHFWYLAVILQVYVLWAVGNYLMQRLPKGLMLAALVIIGLASLAYCYSYPLHEWLKNFGISWWEQDKAPSYYQTLPRVWEILAGGLICVLPSVRKRSYAVGLSLFGLLCVLFFSLGNLIPGIHFVAASLPATLFVVGGTILLLRYLPESGLNGLLANKPLVWLGKISFSIYLVHMPIIFFWKLWQFGQIGTWGMLGAFLLSIPLGYAFWWCIEKRRFTWWQAALLWLAAMGACIYGKKTHGYEWVMQDAMPIKPSYNRWKLNTDPELETGLTDVTVPSGMVFGIMNATNRPAEMTSPLLIMGDYEQKPTIVLMGDSHGSHFYPGFDHVLSKEKLTAVYFSPMVIPLHHCTHALQRRGKINPGYHITPEKEDEMMAWLAAHPELKHIIIAQHWIERLRSHSKISTTNDIAHDLRQFLQRLIAMGKDVILIAPTPEFKTHPLHYYKIKRLRNTPWDVINTTCTREEYLAQASQILSLLHQMQSEGLCSVIEPLNALPSTGFTSIKDDTLYMSDTYHMTPVFSIFLTEGLSQHLQIAKEN